MIRPLFLPLTLLGLLFSVQVWGYEFTHLTKNNNGLSYDGISAIMQDSRGFIWIGTYKGLNRYDGNTFKVYGMAEMGLDSDFVYSIVEDSEGNLWIGTDKGVCMYSYRQDRFIPLRTVSSEGFVDCLGNDRVLITGTEKYTEDSTVRGKIHLMTGRVNRARSLARGVDPLVGPEAFDVGNNDCWYLGRTVPMKVFYDFGCTDEAFVFDTWVFTDKLTAYSVENSDASVILLSKGDDVYK